MGEITTDLIEFRNTYTPLRVIELLEASMMSDSAICKIAEKSYIHDNGFFKLVLKEDPATRAKLRLHLWNTGSDMRTSESNIHNHRWRFCSRILAGEVKYQIFSPARLPGDPYLKYSYSRTNSTTQYNFVESGYQNLSLVEEGTMLTGVTYSLMPNVLHRVTPLSPQLLTLVAHDPPCRPNTDVYTDRSVPIGDGTMQRLTVPEVQYLLEQCCSIIRSANSGIPPSERRQSPY
jgi:hypothetical protein